MGDLIKIIPDIVEYLILGYTFLKVYTTTRSLKKSKDFNLTFVYVFCLGYILSSMFSLIPSTNCLPLDYVGMILCNSVIAYYLARFTLSRYFENILDKLHIKQRVFDTIWQELDDYKDLATYVTLYDYEKKLYYSGRLVYKESFEARPLITLVNYKVLCRGKIVVDYSNDPYHTIIIDTSKFQDIHITYQSSSQKPKEWQSKTKIITRQNAKTEESEKQNSDEKEPVKN